MIETLRTACPYDCPDGCSMLAEVEDGRLIGVKGDGNHPRTQGFLCRKMQHYEEMVNHPDRILYPMKRVGAKGEGVFERISWDEALDEIAARWRDIIGTYGAEAILPYSYAGTEGAVQHNAGNALFHSIGASKLLRTICSSGKGAGWEAIVGGTKGMSSHKLAECDRILVWSSNAAATRIHDAQFIRQAKERGAKVTLIDIYANPFAANCHDIVNIRPGSDGALALAMIHVMVKEELADLDFIREHAVGHEEFLANIDAYSPAWASAITGVDAAVIEELARSYGKAKNPGILLGSGFSRRTNGSMNTRCVVALSAMTGAWVRGFGVAGASMSGAWIDKGSISRTDFDKNGARTINMMQLASALEIPAIAKRSSEAEASDYEIPVMSLFVYNCNPLMVTANQNGVRKGLEREDLFTVVHERFLTDTARYADILLPATFSVEHADIYTPYGYNGMQYVQAICKAPGECRSNWDVVCMLAERMGIEDPYYKKTEDEVCEDLLDRTFGQQAELSDEKWTAVMNHEAVVNSLPIYTKCAAPGGKILLRNDAVYPPLVGFYAGKDENLTPGARADGKPDTSQGPESPASELPNQSPNQRPNQKEELLALVAAPSVYSLNSTFLTQERLMKPRGKMVLLMNPEDAASRRIADGDPVLVSNELGRAAFYAKTDDSVKKGSVVAEGIYTISDSPNGQTVNALFHEELSDLGQATTMNENYVTVNGCNRI